jgi:hypothetical protein
MDGSVIAGVVGTVAGVLFTVGGTWWVSVRLDRQKEHRQLDAAIRIVATELEENRHRIAGGDAKALRQRVTLGDWASNKGAFAGLALRNERLWKLVAETYEGIYEFSKGWRDDHPSADQLSGIVTELHDEQRELGREIRAFSRSLRGRSSG